MQELLVLVGGNKASTKLEERCEGGENTVGRKSLAKVKGVSSWVKKNNGNGKEPGNKWDGKHTAEIIPRDDEQLTSF